MVGTGRAVGARHTHNTMAASNDISGIELYQIGQLTTQHTAVQFDIVRLEQATASLDFLHKPHRNNFYTVMVVQGGAGWHSIDFTSYNFRSGDVFFISPGQVHTFNSVKNATGYIILFSAEFFSMRYNNNVLLEFPFFHSHHNAPQAAIPKKAVSRIRHLIQMLEQEHTGHQPHKDKVLRSYLNILLFELHRIYIPLHPQPDTPSNLSVVRQFEQLIEEHFTQKKQVHEYARQLCMSPNYLNSIVGRITGKSAGQMIRERVMIEARRLLIHTEMTVAEIGYELGFNDNSYFTRFFKKYAAQTPEAFRAGNRNGL